MIILFLSFHSVCELHVLTENHIVKKKEMTQKNNKRIHFYTVRYLFAPVPLFTKKNQSFIFFESIIVKTAIYSGTSVSRD